MKKLNNIVSVVVSDKVKNNRQSDFENWQERIISEIRKFKGFISVSSKKIEDVENEYFTVFQFDSNQNLQHWIESDVLRKYLSEAEQYTEVPYRISRHQGLEFFFDKEKLMAKQPPFYKRVLIGIAAVYPLIISVGQLFHWIIPEFEELPFELALFFEVIVISSLMNYPVMPMLTKWLQGWLYK